MDPGMQARSIGFFSRRGGGGLISEILTRKIKQTKKLDKSPPKSIETKSYKLNVRFIYLKIAAEKKTWDQPPSRCHVSGTFIFMYNGLVCISLIYCNYMIVLPIMFRRRSHPLSVHVLKFCHIKTKNLNPILIPANRMNPHPQTQT